MLHFPLGSREIKFSCRSICENHWGYKQTQNQVIYPKRGIFFSFFNSFWVHNVDLYLHLSCLLKTLQYTLCHIACNLRKLILPNISKWFFCPTKPINDSFCNICCIAKIVLFLIRINWQTNARQRSMYYVHINYRF